jgi:FkbM family methyltransferase
MAVTHTNAPKRRLHIGALSATPGWESLNALSIPGIDHVCDAADLSIFPDDTFEAVYASHVLEHFDYKDVVLSVLREWLRVLAPAGTLLISVPDCDAICRLFCDRDQFDAQDRWNFTRMLIGGHVDRYDYHQSLFNEEILVYFLQQAGFGTIRRGTEFGLFNDTSAMRYKGELISLNLSAVKPPEICPTQFSTDGIVAPPDNAIKTEDLRHVSFSITRNGVSHTCSYLFDISQPTQRNLAAHIFQGSLYEPEISLFLMRILQRGDCFVDVGANVGFFPVMAAQLVSDAGKVYAFEPETANFQRLKHNISLNSLSNVELIHAAVGDQNQTTSLYINSDNDGGHALWNPGAHSFNKLSRERVQLQQINMLTLDSYFRSRQECAERIRIIKIDAEGYEHHVVMGSLETIRHHDFPFVLAEINRLALQQSGTDEMAFRRFMRHLGYNAYMAEVSEKELSLRFLEMPSHFIPSPENPEAVYNVTFSAPGKLEHQGFIVTRSGELI